MALFGVGVCYGACERLPENLAVLQIERAALAADLDQRDRNEQLSRAMAGLSASSASRTWYKIGLVLEQQYSEAKLLIDRDSFASPDCDRLATWLVRQSITKAQEDRFDEARHLIGLVPSKSRPNRCRSEIHQLLAGQINDKARSFISAEDYARGDGMYELAMAIAASYPLTYYLLGDSLSRQGRSRDAISSIRRGLGLDADPGQIGYPWLCRAYLVAASDAVTPEEQLSAGEECLEHGAVVWGNTLMGNAFFRTGDYAGARSSYLAALESNESGPTSLSYPYWIANLNLGQVYEEEGEYSLALTWYRTALAGASSPSATALSLYHMAMIYSKQSNQPEADAALQQSYNLVIRHDIRGDLRSQVLNALSSPAGAK